MRRALAVLAATALASGIASAQDLARAEKIAGEVCAACHAAGSTVPENPKITGQIAEYLAKQLADFKAQKGKPPARVNPIMNGMVAGIVEADLKSLAAYYSRQKLVPAAASDKKLAALGEDIWRGGIAETGVPACSGCHGPAGAGIPAQYPRLAGQFAQYLAGQLRAFKEGTRANDPNGMMRAVAARMTEEQIRAVAEYAAGLR